MTFRPACLAVGFTFGQIAFAAEPPGTAAANVSPIRQFLHDSIKAKLPPKPAEPPPATEATPADQPIVLPTFRVEESRDKQERRALAIVEGQRAMEERLSYHPVFKNDRIEILQRPIMDDLPSHLGVERLKLNILQLKF